MERLLGVKDRKGRDVYLTKERWSHISMEHPEVSSYVNEFETVLNKPTKIVEYTHDKSVCYYYKHFKSRKDKPAFLLIIVKYLNGEGFIITAYFVRKI